MRQMPESNGSAEDNGRAFYLSVRKTVFLCDFALYKQAKLTMRGKTGEYARNRPGRRQNDQ